MKYLYQRFQCWLHGHQWVELTLTDRQIDISLRLHIHADKFQCYHCRIIRWIHW